MSARAAVLRIEGLDCAEEVAALKRAVGPVVGGEERLGFDVLAGKMTVPAGSDLERVVAAVAATGMQATLWREAGGDEAASSAAATRRAKARLTLLSGLLTAAGFAVHVAAAGGILAAIGVGEIEGFGAHEVSPWAQALYLAAIVAGGWFVAPKAWLALRRLRPDMNLLMTIAVFGAVAIGEWLEAATVAFLFALSLALEAWSVGRARRAVEALMKLAPSRVRLIGVDGGESEVEASTAPLGVRFRVRPGERIALDGRVVAGASDVDQAPITGESEPVAKAAGDEVFAGTINGRGALEIESTRPAGDTTLARILRSVEEARSRRSPPSSGSSASPASTRRRSSPPRLAVALGGPVLFALAWSDALYRGLALLVIGCPCALVVSTPVAVVAALASAARHGVLLRSGRFVEEPARIATVAMDKTGTLTHGRPVVDEVVPLAEHDERELVERAAALEAHSEHPIAHAIRARAAALGLAVPAAESFEILPGRGAQGTIGGRPFWIGSHRYLEERGEETPEVHARIEALAASGRTVVVVGNASHVCGLIALVDEVRPEAKALIGELRAAGVRRVVMLTGDHAPTAERVARECGIDEVRSELLPEEKLAAIEELVERDGRVAMVGDGVNDAPALARATVGVAMGTAGADVAIEVADVTLMSDDLSRLPWLMGHSRRTLAVIRQNVGFALAIKAVFVVLALAGHASLWAAIAADMGATLAVIANALRLLRA